MGRYSSDDGGFNQAAFDADRLARLTAERDEDLALLAWFVTRLSKRQSSRTGGDYQKKMDAATDLLDGDT